MKDLLFFVAVYGMAVTIALLHAGAPIRFIASYIDFRVFKSQKGGAIKVLFHCPACLSFWISMIVHWVAVYSPSLAHFGCKAGVAFILDAFISTGTIWIVHVTLTKLGQYDL